jgi:SOS-response transcriptional repressor LexA
MYFSNEHKEISEFDIYVLDWIKAYIVSNGFPPTLDEIKDHYGFSSKKMVLMKLKKLQEWGFIQTVPNTPRGIRIFDFPMDDVGSHRIKQWLIEGIILMNRYMDVSIPEVKTYLDKVDIFAY